MRHRLAFYCHVFFVCLFFKTLTSSTTRRCLMSLSWWRGNHFMHIKFCCLQHQPGKVGLWIYCCLFYIFLIKEEWEILYSRINSMYDFVFFIQVQVTAPKPSSCREHLYWDQSRQVQYIPRKMCRLEACNEQLFLLLMNRLMLESLKCQKRIKNTHQVFRAFV